MLLSHGITQAFEPRALSLQLLRAARPPSRAIRSQWLTMSSSGVVAEGGKGGGAAANFLVQSTYCKNGYAYIGALFCRKIFGFVLPPKIPNYATDVVHGVHLATITKRGGSIALLVKAAAARSWNIFRPVDSPRGSSTCHVQKLKVCLIP